MAAQRVPRGAEAVLGALLVWMAFVGLATLGILLWPAATWTWGAALAVVTLVFWLLYWWRA